MKTLHYFALSILILVSCKQGIDSSEKKNDLAFNENFDQKFQGIEPEAPEIIRFSEANILEMPFEDSSLNCKTTGAKSPYFLGLGDGFKTLTYKFTNSNWSNITNTCGFNEASARFWTAPFDTFNKYQMFVFADTPRDGRIMYSNCEEGELFYLDSKPGYKYYVYVNDTSGDHEDNHGTISFCYSLE